MGFSTFEILNRYNQYPPNLSTHHYDVTPNTSTEYQKAILGFLMRGWQGC